MKVVVLPNEKTPKKNNQFENIPPLTDDEGEQKQLKKGMYSSTFCLRTEPTDADSPTYNFVVPYLYPDATIIRQAMQFQKKNGTCH